MTEGVDDQASMVAVELPHAADLVAKESRIDPEPLGAGAVEGLVLDLPADQRGVVAVAEHGSLHESQRGGAQARIRCDVLALVEGCQVRHRGWNEELRPAERLHADGENDGLPRSLSLVHQPVELVVALCVHLIPVGAKPDDAKMHGLQSFEGAAIVETEVAGAHRTEADPDLYRRSQAVSLH